ncbi:MAG: hypothetical protein K2K81_10305, partial [Muribaculaceae bacterium]|nr:hypothetical protein [Muribaculaceae bacterium]
YMKHTATVQVTKQEWEAIQASLRVDLREDTEGYDEELINKYDLRAGTNPATYVFKFEDGREIIMDWYVEEFGGAINWYDDGVGDTLTGDVFCLNQDESWNNEDGDIYTCHFEIIEE